jgi:2-keto-3-deoxy-L-rhamnonate aldolase RhmA
MAMRDYMQAANEEMLSIITIDHPEAVKNIDQSSRPGG